MPMMELTFFLEGSEEDSRERQQLFRSYEHTKIGKVGEENKVILVEKTAKSR